MRLHHDNIKLFKTYYQLYAAGYIEIYIINCASWRISFLGPYVIRVIPFVSIQIWRSMQEFYRGVYDVTWTREHTSVGNHIVENVEILSRNGKVDPSNIYHLSGRIRSWVSETTKGDEYGLMVSDTNRSLDEGIYSCQGSTIFLSR